MVEPVRSRWIRRVGALCLVGAGILPGCAVVPREQYNESQRLTQSLRGENARLKDEIVGLQTQNRDYADRALDDLRRLTARDQAILSAWRRASTATRTTATVWPPLISAWPPASAASATTVPSSRPQSVQPRTGAVLGAATIPKGLPIQMMRTDRGPEALRRRMTRALDGTRDHPP